MSLTDSINNQAPHSWGFLFVGWCVDLSMEKYGESAEEVMFSDSRLEKLEEIVDMIPGALEKLKSMKSIDEKYYYYEELLEIASKLEEFKEGKEEPN